MTSQTSDRATLNSKDRDALVQIATGLGIKSLSRMKKTDLVDAIVGSAADSNGKSDAPAKRTIRSAKASDADPLAKLASEQESMAGSSTRDAEEAPLPISRRRKPANESVGPESGSSETTAANTESTATESVSTSANESTSGSSEGTQQQGYSRPQGGPRQGGQGGQDRQRQGGQGQQQFRDNDANNKNRRRRRGRSRGGVSEFEQVESESAHPFTGELIAIAGLVDLRDEGYAFLRTTGYLPGRNDAYVSASLVRRHALRKGDYVRGGTRPATSTEKYAAVGRIDEVNGTPAEEPRNRPRFEDLTPLFPDSRLTLELTDQPLDLTGRIVDLVSPIGKGQRGMIVSPPKAGKTTIIKQIVASIERNNPECHVMILQVDERPEEVTDMKRHVLRAEVISSTFDRPSEEHCHVAELAIERAKRLVELGKDVVVILDGITRLARAYNLAAPASGRIMSGGIDAGALYPPKKFFGAARNVEEGGSLTIIATALVETNSKMDEHIFEEFKGTGNMELRLDRRLSERRIFPAIDVDASSTRHEELLFDRQQLSQVWKLRRVLHALEGDNEKSGKGLELLIDKLRTTRSNDEFLSEIAKAPSNT